MGMFNFVLDSFKGEIFDFKVKRQGLIAGTVFLECVKLHSCSRMNYLWMWSHHHRKNCTKNFTVCKFLSLNCKKASFQPTIKGTWAWPLDHTSRNLFSWTLHFSLLDDITSSRFLELFYYVKSNPLSHSDLLLN